MKWLQCCNERWIGELYLREHTLDAVAQGVHLDLLALRAPIYSLTQHFATRISIRVFFVQHTSVCRHLGETCATSQFVDPCCHWHCAARDAVLTCTGDLHAESHTELVTVQQVGVPHPNRQSAALQPAVQKRHTVSNGRARDHQQGGPGGPVRRLRRRGLPARGAAAAAAARRCGGSACGSASSPPRLCTRHRDRQLQLLCKSLHVDSSKMTAEKVLVFTGRSRGRV
jgi:hypothetical protein